MFGICTRSATATSMAEKKDCLICGEAVEGHQHQVNNALKAQVVPAVLVHGQSAGLLHKEMVEVWLLELLHPPQRSH